MNDNESPLKTIFAKNRTEELGSDVYKHFVIPPFFDKFNLRVARKPKLFIGGRGCGKTMLLRYLSHQSAFSPDRQQIPNNEIEHIGLYWRVDTQFASVMNERGLPCDVWHSAFKHLVAIFLALEVLKSIKNISASKCELLSVANLENITIEKLSVFDDTLTGSLDNIINALESRLWQFELWVANVRKKKEPMFLPGTQFLLPLISQIKLHFPSLKPAIFFVYVDEFENLLPYQQKILNTCLKHSEAPLIFNIAMKRHAFETTETVGTESIQDIADYRKYDLEEYLTGDAFAVFAAEVLFLNLALAGVNDVPIHLEQLQNPESLDLRKENAYQALVISRVKQIFPTFTHEQLAEGVFESETLKRKLFDRIQQALKIKKSKFKPEAFYRPAFASATLISTALLHRRKLKPEEILKELDLLEQGKPNNFTGTRGWIHNNFIGCLLWLYESHSTTCPFYSGFETFCLLARGNLRHFLELCHVSINQLPGNYNVVNLAVPQQLQAKAARQASAAFLHEIPAFGRFGDKLHTFVFRLGSLFALAHRRPTQSEPEISHFSISKGSKPLSFEVTKFLNEAEKWSVIFQVEETKIKAENIFSNFEYVLNPVYSPFFNITYRKRRKLELSSDDVEILIQGSFEDAGKLLKRFSNNWEMDDSLNMTLFFQFPVNP